jgi:uncharacterized OB-fold protein
LKGGIAMDTCVMCGAIVLNGNHVCKYCREKIENEKNKEG